MCEQPSSSFEWDAADPASEDDRWFYDDISGKTLPTTLVQSASAEEIKFIDKIKLWEAVPRSNMEADSEIVDTRWVDVNKGDEDMLEVRSRLVAREIKKRKSTIGHYFAAMPPLHALKFLFSIAVTVIVLVKELSVNLGRGQKLLQFLDIKKAHFWPTAVRRLYVELPEEWKVAHGVQGQDVVGRLLRSMYGMIDAAQLWGKLVAATMRGIGFVQGTSTPCTFWHPVRDIRTSLHGDNVAS